MVKFRGIEISIISQFDIRKLPEFRFRQYSPLPPDPSYLPTASRPPSGKAVASCYVPIYPGSQVWFEYCIDAPHPDGSAYFFKFLLNGKVVTSWDCTEKHDYHGKMMYNLAVEGHDYETGTAQIVRQALKFSSEIEEHNDTTETKDVIEIRVHRIEHRKRIRDLSKLEPQTNFRGKVEDNLQLSSGGLLEPGLPARRYKYQLLDPVDEPFATFRFYYRTYDFLEKNGIFTRSQYPYSDPYDTGLHDASSVFETANAVAPSNANTEAGTESSSLPYSVKIVASQSDLALSSDPNGHDAAEGHDPEMDNYLPPSDSEESLSIVTKDSIEDLPSTVPRSPGSAKFSESLKNLSDKEELDAAITGSPPLSPKRRLKKKLTVNIGGAEFDLEPKRRPLSPFTSGGMLRKLTGGIPPSAPAAVTEFGQTIEEEVQEKLKAEQKPGSLQRISRAERGGKTLMGFLGRRIGSA